MVTHRLQLYIAPRKAYHRFAMRGGRWVLLTLCAVLLCSQTRVPSAPVTVLRRGTPVDGELTAGGTAAYRIAAAAGDYLQVVMEQVDGGVVVTLASPAGAKLQEARSFESPYFALAAIASMSGDYTVEVHYDSGRPALFRVAVDEMHPAGAQDEVRIAAWKSYFEGNAFLARNPTMVNKPPAPLVQGVELHQKALADFRSIDDRFGEAVVLTELGAAGWYLHDSAAAIDRYHEAQAAWHDLGRSRGERDVLPGLAMAHRSLGESDVSIVEWQQFLESARAGQDLPAEAMGLAQLADTYQQMDDPEQQIETLLEALRLSARRQGRMEGNLLDRIASVYMRLHEYPTALDYLHRWEAIERSQGQVSPAVLEEIGEVYDAMGDHSKALDYYRDALPKRKFSLYHANNLFRIGEINASLSNYTSALESMKEAVEIYLAYPNPGVATGPLVSIARIYLKMGDRPTALEYLRRAKAIAEVVRDPTMAGLLSDLAEAWLESGEQEEARSCYQAALELKGPAIGPMSDVEWYAGLARVERDLGELGKARSHIEAALGLYESMRARIRSADFRSAYFTGARAYYDFYVNLLMRMHQQEPEPPYAAEALQASERGRARTLLETLMEARADIRHGIDPQLLKQERGLQQRLNARALWQQQVLMREHTSQEANAVATEIRGLNADLERVEALIRARSPGYAALTEPAPLSYPEIQQLAGSGTLLLEYFLGDEHSYLWAVTGNSISVFPLPPRERIDEAARRLYDLVDARGQHPKGETGQQRLARIAQADAAYPKAAAALSDMVLGPAKGLLGRRRLAIVADGGLAYVPFAALPDPQTTEPLAVRHETVLLPSATVLAEMRREVAARKPAPKAVAILADPVFDRNDERVTGSVAVSAPEPRSRDLERSATEVGLAETGGRIPRLPFSRAEAQSILSLAPAASTLMAVDFEASRATGISPSLAQYRVIHIATHGLLNSETPALSGIVLSLVDRHGQPQNGFLRLNEIYNLNLPANLVVLSACQTALGKDIRGEGLVGLTRGFMYAGAARVAASLWKVDDAATAGLMAQFYKSLLADHLPAAAALRAAQTWMRTQPQWQSPYYWAAFELQGEWK